MLYLLNKDVRTVRWNGEPLHEATSAIVKETMNGDFTLTVKYPISDSGIYQLIQEDMLIKAPTPVLGAQLFRIKKPVEHNDHLEITAYHISDDVMQRSITPISVTSQSCGMALSRMVQNTKTALGDFSFNSDIQDRRTFNTTETETLYSVLLDGKHSIVGTWEGELVRDNFAMTVKKNRGENRGVVITTHKNLKDYQRTRNSQNVVTRIHAKSTFKTEGAEKETTIRVTVDSPLINSYPYINEKEYENNNAKTVEELQKWAQSKFSNEGIDKVSDAIKIEAYELDGQVVHIGDTVNLKSWKHNVDAFKKAIAYEFDALKEEYISLTFDDKAGTGGSRASGGLSSAADAILGVTESAQEIALEKALQNADLDFDHKAELLRQEISDGIELARARAEEVKQELSDTINQRFNSFDNGPLQEVKRRAEEALRNAGASTLLAQEAKRIGLDSVAKLEEFKRQATSAQTALSGDLDALKKTVTSEVNQASEYRRTTTEALSRMTGQMNGFATKSEVAQGIDGLTQTFAKMRVGGRNLLRGSKGPFLPDRKPANFDNNILYVGNTSIYMEQGQEYIISAKTDGNFTAHHDGFKESDNVVLWIMDKDIRNYQIVSDLKTGTTGTKIIWNKPTGIYHLRVNTYHKEATKSVWDVKIEKGNIATDWSPAPEDTEGIITEAKSTFERTAQGLRTDLSAIQEYVNKDGQRQEVLRKYTRDESARQATAVRELVTRDYVGKASYQEDVRAIERKFETITNPQNGSIATQIANYKTAVDGRFADITSLISGKANQTDFQRVKETSQLYERILGNTENGIADKVARMAMTNQLFQVEVGKAFAEHQNLFLSSTLTKGFLGNNGIINVANATQKEVTSDFISVDPNEKIIFQHWVTLPENGMAWTAWQFFDKNKNPIDNRKPGLNAYKTTVGKQHNINQITVPANAYFVRFSARMYDDGLIKVEKGSAPSDYSVAPNDALEAVKTVQRQLAGSWGVHNKNSVNEIIAGFNLAGRNAGIKAETIRLEGNTLADKLTAIDGYFKRLFVGEGTFATLNADVIRTNSITADKLVFNEALANRLVSNEIITSKLVASRAFVNALKAVTIDASQIVTGTLKGDRIYGGTIRGTEINGTTITGNSRITIGDNGFLRPTQEGGLQINVPETFNANNGIGVQLFGRNFGKIPKGMFIYNSPNWDGGNLIGESVADTLLTVKGLTSLCNLYRGQPMSGLPINSNFSYGNPVEKLYRISFIAWDSRHGQMFVNDGTDTDGTWWFKPDASSSDKRLKTNIQDTDFEATDFVKKLEFKKFDWKPDKFGYKKPYTNVGLIAQDVEKLDSSLVYSQGENLALDDFRLGNIALKAIQELSQRIETLERKLA